jgi:hypothetical protein
MEKQEFESIRLALFVKSYAGNYFIQHINKSRKPDDLFKKLAQVLLFPEMIMMFFLCSKKSIKVVNKIIREIDNKDKEKIKVYLKIEQQLTQFIRDKKLEENYIVEEYEHALLSPAIERIAGNSLSRITNDARFERELIKRKQLYTYWYYSRG